MPQARGEGLSRVQGSAGLMSSARGGPRWCPLRFLRDIGRVVTAESEQDFTGAQGGSRVKRIAHGIVQRPNFSLEVGA